MKQYRKHAIWSLFLCLWLLWGHTDVHAQGKRRTVRLSGLVVQGDSAYAMPGVHVMIKGVNRGTVTDQYGHFSIPTILEGDTLLFSYVGYKRRQFIVPRGLDEGMSVLVNMKEEATILPVIEIFPYPTKELFKEAFLTLKLPLDEREVYAKRNLDPVRIRAMAYSLDASPNELFRHQMGMQTFGPGGVPLGGGNNWLNPFAWAKFIQSLKDKKKK